jgi:hypothetical protein
LANLGLAHNFQLMQLLQSGMAVAIGVAACGGHIGESMEDMGLIQRAHQVKQVKRRPIFERI